MTCTAGSDAESEDDYSLREAVAVFSDDQELEDVIEDLQLAGFDRDQLRQLASWRAAEAELGHRIGSVRELEDEPDLPARNYADRHERAQGAAALTSGLALLCSLTAIGLVVAAGGALGLTIASAVAAGGVGGGIGGLIVRALGKRRARKIDEQLRQGGLLLWVELRNAAQEGKALEILQRHSGEDVHVNELVRSRGPDAARIRRRQRDPVPPEI
jgi:hypothetical protein